MSSLEDSFCWHLESITNLSVASIRTRSCSSLSMATLCLFRASGSAQSWIDLLETAASTNRSRNTYCFANGGRDLVTSIRMDQSLDIQKLKLEISPGTKWSTPGHPNLQPRIDCTAGNIKLAFQRSTTCQRWLFIELHAIPHEILASMENKIKVSFYSEYHKIAGIDFRVDNLTVRQSWMPSIKSIALQEMLKGSAQR